VFCSEAYYDRADDPQQAYHARWQVWTAMLSGCAGYGYGAQGLWQFYDPADSSGETGQKVNAFVPWKEAIRFEGSQSIRPLRTLFDSLPWWKLTPSRSLLLVDGQASPLPGPADLTPPTTAAISGQLYLVYIPRGNAARTLRLRELRGDYRASWFNQRDGHELDMDTRASGPAPWVMPARPQPADEDWVCVLRAAN
jgi:hypothetical protein